MYRIFGLTCFVGGWVVSLTLADIAPPSRKHLAFVGIEKYPDYEFYLYFKYSKSHFLEGKREHTEYEYLSKIFDADPMDINDFQRAGWFEVIAIPKKTIQELGKPIPRNSRPDVQGMLVASANAKSKYPAFSGSASDRERNEIFRYHVNISNGELTLTSSEGFINSQNRTQWIVGVIIPIAILSLLVWRARRNRTKNASTPPPSVA